MSGSSEVGDGRRRVDGSGPLVVPLTAVGSPDVARAGGKAANLGELVTAGFPVPPGVVVTTAAYRQMIEASGLATTVAAVRTPDDASRLRAAIRAAPVPPDVVTAVVAAYHDLGAGPVAVRSSATAEDLPGAAFAGQQDTYLGVAGDDAVVDAVRRCWASLWTDRAVAYRDRRRDRRAADAGVEIAVVVQRMVDPDVAGVLFTADPLTGARDRTVVDAAPGLGEAVVSGEVTPEHVVLDRRGRVVESSVGEVPRGLLPPRVRAELVDLGARIETHFGRPQDVEWAWADGALWIVQARPLTALPPEPLRVGPLRRFAGSIVAELLPVRPYPLDMSTWTVHGHGRILTRMAWEIPAVRVDLHRMLPEVDGVVDRLVPPDFRPTWRTPATPLRMLPRVRRFHAEDWTADPRFAEFDRRIAALRALDLATLSWAQVTGVPRTALDALDVLVDLRVDHLPGVGAALLRLRVLLTALGLHRYAAPLMRGMRTRTDDANRDLAGIADRIRTTPAWRRAFASPDDDALVDAVEHDPELPALRDALARHVAEYGHRETTSPFLASQPTWGEDGRLVVGALRAMVEHGPPGAPTTRTAEPAERAVLALRRVRLTRSGPAVLRAAHAARAGVAFREDTHFHAMRPLPVLRAALLQAGERLARAGVLDRPEDVLHLRLEEIEAVRDPVGMPPEQAERLRAAVGSRSARRSELAGVPLISPATLHPRPRLRRPPRRRALRRRPAVTALVTGTPASGGRAAGPVRVVRDLGDFGLLRPGDVLVCPYTNPSWTPLFAVAAAVVVDTGGVASHAAIVAREYGIPAVMGTGDGTRVLADGRRVTVDGDAGQVLA